MDTSKREAARQLERAQALRDARRSLTMAAAPAWLKLPRPLREYRVWQRAVAAFVALTLFTGPLALTFEQGASAAGVLAAGNPRLDDEAWQVIRDLASMRVRLGMQLAQAAPIVDPTAPIMFQPKITQSTGAGGGVPVVNITAPNGAGISLNQYQSFNVDAAGLILNNSLMAGTSLTGGNVGANPNLNGRTASVIVNQVTSTGTGYASLLNGPLEVFGAPATVIIANPNGVSTQGVSFTNTIGVTLTTGTPQFLSAPGGTATSFDNAQAVGYNVTGGHIQIEGNPGVNGPGAGIEGTVGSIDLIGETIGVNAPLYAGTRINVIAGDQFVSPSQSTANGTPYTTASNGSVNAANSSANNGLAVDATAFGAMTAGQIQVIATAAGMGVRSDAQLAANTGDITLSSNGDVTLAGTAAQQQVNVQAGGNVALTGTHVGVAGYTINANGDVTSAGSIQSGANLSVNAGGNINLADMQSAGDTTLAAGSNVSTGTVQTGGALSLAAAGHDGTGDVTLGGTTVVTGTTQLQAARDVNISGATGSGALQANATRNVNVNAALQGSGDITLSASGGNVSTTANVNSNGNLTLAAGQSTSIAAQATALGAVTLSSGAGGIAVSGSLASGTTLNATTSGLFSVPGSLLVGTNAVVSASSIDVPGVVLVQKDGSFSALGGVTGSGSIAFGQSGTLAAGQDIALTGKLLANGLQVSAARNATLADVQAGGALQVSAGSGNATFNGNAAIVGATSVQAGGDIDVNGTLAGGAGVSLGAQGNVNVASGGTVQSVGSLAMTAGSSIVSSGTLQSGGALNAQAQQDVSLTGTTSAATDIVLNAGRDVITGGTLAGQGGATITAGRDVTLGGNIGIAKNVNISSANNLTTTGSLQGNNVTLDAGNSATLGDVQANAALAVITHVGDLRINGTVESLGNGTVNAAGSVTVPGTLETVGTLAVTAAQNTTVSGTLQSNGDMTLANTSGSLAGTGTIQSGANLSATAGQSINLGAGTTAALGDMTLNAGQDVTLGGSVVAQGNGTINAGGNLGGAGSLAFGLAASLSSGADTNLTGSLRGATVQTSAGGSASFGDVQGGSTVALGATGSLTLNGTLAGGAGVSLTGGQDVNVNGTLQSAADALLTATNGSVNVNGAIGSNGALTVTAGTDVTIGGTATIALDTTLQAGRDVNVGGTLSGQGNGSVSSGRDITGAGTLAFGGNALLNASGAIAQAGLVQGQTVQIQAAGDAALNNIESTTTLVMNAGTAGSGSLTINGAAAAAGSVSATANGDVTVNASGKLAAGTSVSVAALNGINVAGAIESNGDATLVAREGSLAATGGINTGGNLNVTTGLDLSLGASTSATSDATLTAGRDAILNGTLIGTNGSITAGRDITGGGTQAFTQAAVLGAQRDIALTGALQATSVQASGGDNAALNDVSSATTLALTANGALGNGDAAITGTATAQGSVTLNAARDVLASGSLGSATTLALNAQRNVQVTGGLESVGDLGIDAANGSVMLSGTAATSGAFNVSAGLDAQLGGQTAVVGDVTVQAGRDVLLTGTVAGQTTGTLNAGRDITGAGTAAFGGSTTLVAANNLGLTGVLQGSGVTVTGGNNAGLGSVQAVTGDLNVTANGGAGGGDVTFTGTATAFGNATLQAARDVTVSGATNVGGTTTVTGARNVTTGDINSTGDLMLMATSGNLSAGNVTTQGNLSGTAGQALTFTGLTQSGANVTLGSGGNMALNGGIAAQGTGLLQAGGSISGASVAFGLQATLNAGNNIAISGDVATNGDLTATAGNGLSMGSATAGGAINLQAKGQGGTGDLVVTNGATSGGATTLTAARDVQVGALSGGTTLDVSAGRNLSVAGAVAANGDVTLNAGTGNASVSGSVTTKGNLNVGAGGSATLSSGALVNGNATVTSGAGMSLGGAFLGLGAGIFNAGGAITGGGSLSFVGNIGVTSGGAITLGAVEGAGTFTATSTGNMSFGAVTTEGKVSATSTAGSVAFSGTVESGGNVQIQAASNVTAAGGIASMGTVNVTGTNGNVSVAGVSSNGDATITAGQGLTLNASSTVAGNFMLSGNNVTISGTQAGSKDIDVTALGTLDASGAALISSGNLQLTGADVTLGNALVGGWLKVQASDQIATLSGSEVDVVGAASFTAQNGFTNAASVLAGGNLVVSAANVTNTASGSLASIATTTIDATNFTNAGLVNGTNTVIDVTGSLTNVGGALMGLNSLAITTGTLNNQGGLIFAGDATGTSGGAGNLSLTATGGGGAFYNAGGQILAINNAALAASRLTFDGSSAATGTISAGNTLSMTFGSVSVAGTWDLSAGNVAIQALNGFLNNGTVNSTGTLTISSGGAISNSGQIISGGDVDLAGSLSNAQGAVINAGNDINLSGSVANAGTIEATRNLTFAGTGDYNNANGTSQANGTISLSTPGNVYNTGGTIAAGGDLDITATAVVNDAIQGATVTTTQLLGASADPTLIGQIVIGTESGLSCAPGGNQGNCFTQTYTDTITIASIDPNVSSGVLNVETDGYCDLTGACFSAAVGKSLQGQVQGIALPGIDQTTTTTGAITPSVMIAGGSINVTANSLSNAGGSISAALDVNLNLQSLNNAPLSNVTTTIVNTVDQGQLNAFMAQLAGLGSVAIAGTGSPTNNIPAYSAIFNSTASSGSDTSTTTSFGQQGGIVAGRNMTLGGGNLVNGGLLYAGNNIFVTAASLQNQGQNLTNTSTQPGCAAGVSGQECNSSMGTRGDDPNSSTFSYAQQGATIYAGNDLVIAAGDINNTYGNLLAGHNIVIGGVGTTATSTTPAQSLNNTSGNIVAGNNITLDVSGSITNNLPPPVQVHQNYGTQEQYAGCMTAGGYKESYCEAYVDQQSGSSSVISAGNSLQINAGSLTNIGSLISAGMSATINVSGPVVNEAQTLNAYWHSEWVQQTGMFSSDIRHNTWACGSVAECTALYGSAYTSVGGTIDPATPVGNIAATIQAPNLSITSGGQIQNVGNVLGTYVSLTGQKLINGITTANTYTPTVNAPSQVISLSPQNMPGLNISTPRTVGAPLPTPVAGTASYVDGALGTQAIGPQQLLDNLPASLQPSSTLFYYNPQEEDVMLQQAALAQTGQASFVNGLSYDSQTGASVTDQEKADLYGNAIAYAEQNNIQLGQALTQTQINALSAPMLWYVEQTVPDPACTATGSASCPTITALMPQVYLPANSTALSAGGNIEAGSSLTLNFGNAATGGSITNTGSIASGGSLTVNTGTLTNEANQVNVGQIWNSVKGGYTDTTGTEVQPGGFMSAVDMSLNVATLNQIGGALQELGADGTVDTTGTQQLIAQLQQQLGGDFTQTSVSDDLHTDFVKQGGGLPMFVVAAIAIAASIVTAGAAAAAMGATLLTMTLGESIVAGAVGGMAGSAASEIASGNGLNLGAILEAGAIGAITAGLTNGITYNSTTGSLGLGNLNQGLDSLPQDTSTLGQLAGISSIGSSLAGTVTQAGETTAQNLPEELAALGATATINAGVQTAIEGGSFLTNLEHDAAIDAAAVGANFIGGEQSTLTKDLGQAGGELAYLAAHAGLGCLASAADGTGCAGGAIGGATSAAFSADLIKEIDPAGAALDPGQQAVLAGFATVLGGGLAGLAGANATGGSSAAQNEALNNAGATADVQKSAQSGGVLSKIGNWVDDFVTDTYSNPGGSLANWGGQFWRLVLGTSSPQTPQNPDDLGSNGGSNNAPPTAGAVVTRGILGAFAAAACADGVLSSCGAALLPPTVTSGSGSPPNAIFSSGSGTGDAPSSGATNTTKLATVDSAIGNSTAGFENITNSGSRSLNLQGNGGMAGAQEYLNSLPVVPGSATTTANGAQVVTLIDGSKATLYPVSTSGGVPTIQIFRPNGSYSSTKIRF